MNRISRPHFHPVIDVGETWNVADLSRGCDPAAISLNPPTIGRYNEKRRNMYTAGLFGGVRDIHMGLDFFVPAGTPVYAFEEGVVLFYRDNDRTGDYGPTIVTVHKIDPELLIIPGHSVRSASGQSSNIGTGKGQRGKDSMEVTLFALYGHLNRGSLNTLHEGMPLKRGQIIAEVGDEHENGGWIPHLHFQLSWERPLEPDMPGVVSDHDIAKALRTFPDPQIVTGRFY